MFPSIPHLLWKSIESFPEKEALRYYRGNKWNSLTYSQFGKHIRWLTHGLTSFGLKPDDKIAILSNNRPEWTISDFAIFSLRGVVVPIYPTLPANQIAFILQDSDTRAIFVEDDFQYQKIMEIKNSLLNLEYIFTYEAVKPQTEDTFPYHKLIERGHRHLREHPDFYQQTLDAIQPETICTIVYTSGTTGQPKGVMLHHKGFITDVVNSESVLGLYPDDVFLSFLPLSHLYERLAGHWCPMYKGATIVYARSLDTVVDDIAIAKPTVMVSVPRLYEKIRLGVKNQVEEASWLKQKIFNWAFHYGKKYQQNSRQQNPGFFSYTTYKIAHQLVFRKIHEKLGGRLRCPISGGAPLPVEVLQFFEAMGLPIIEGYGMTETHLIIALTPPGNIKYGSCGKPIPGVQVKIAEDQEVLVAGDTVMAGYYNRPDLTAEVIDEQGWLHTGDMGYLDEENYLFLTDRKKNILVTAGGKNVAPAPIENALKQSIYIEDVCLIGDKRKFISAIIVPNYEALYQWAAGKGTEVPDNESLVNHPEIQKLMQEEIDRHQAEFARFEKVKKFILLPQPLSIEKGELTPSLKIKRKVVEEHYKDQINRLYQE